MIFHRTSYVLTGTLLLGSATAQAVPCTLSTVTIDVAQHGIAAREIVLDISQGDASFNETDLAPFTRRAVVGLDAQGKAVGTERTTDAETVGYQVAAVCSGDRVQLEFSHVAKIGTQSIPMALVDQPSMPPKTERFRTRVVLFGRPESNSAKFEGKGWSYTLRAE